jgi:hypothetical protein
MLSPLFASTRVQTILQSYYQADRYGQVLNKATRE